MQPLEVRSSYMGVSNHTSVEIKDGKQIFTLCGVQGCCPTICQTDDGKYEIRDDNGGNVVLTEDEFKALQSVKFTR